jgi:TolB-like protein
MAKTLANPVKLMLLLSMLLFMSSSAAHADGNYRGQGIQVISYDEFARAGIEPKVSKVFLDPTNGWVHSNVFVKEGDLVNISASGLVDPGVRLSRGPDGEGHDLLKEMVRYCSYVALLARLGDGTPFCAGSSMTFRVVTGGPIFFHVNELDELRYDDLGHFDIEVRVISADAAKNADNPPSPSRPKYKPLVAVLQLVPANISDLEAQALSTAVHDHLARGNKYMLIDQSQVFQKLYNLQVKGPDLLEPKAAAKVGKSLDADKVVIGQVNKVGDSFSVTLQLVDVETARVENTVVDVYKCSWGELSDKIGKSVQKL